jgi:hypothetical protein
MCDHPIDPVEFCNAKCLCLATCSDADRDTCVSEWNADHDEAIAERCEEPFEAWAECISSGSGCQGSDYDAGCLAQKNTWQVCVTG